jgi:hypothetical protein
MYLVICSIIYLVICYIIYLVICSIIYLVICSQRRRLGRGSEYKLGGARNEYFKWKKFNFF